MFGEPLKLQRGARTTPPLGCITGLVFLIYLSSLVTATGRIAFMDHSINSSLVLTQTTLNFSIKSFRIAFSFLTCNEGQLLYQSGNSGDFFKLFLKNSSFYISWKSGATEVKFNVANHLEKNAWYSLDIFERTGDIRLHLQKGGITFTNIIIANSTYRISIFRINLSGNSGLQIGGAYFTGCVMQGPYVVFVNNPNIVESEVTWNDTTCPLSSAKCKDSQEFNDCWNGPCLNGGTCNDLVNMYNCTCSHLYNGTNCENDLSIYGCTVLPCLNGGTCLNQNDGSRNYKCVCVNGFNGVNCETSINECASGPCKHDSRCVDGINSYRCDCNGTGFIGTTCNNDIDECNSTASGVSVCGVGTCFNTEGSFTCQCPRGFDGPNCQNNVNDCSSSPCLNSGTCTDGVATYTCNCAIGYEGDNCQNNTDDCKNVQCTGQNSRCVDGINSHSCECKLGFTGSPGSCVDIDECNPYPCRNGATCENLENAYNCLCLAGFTGSLCQSDINECSPDPCKNGAPCTDLVNSYRCDCLPGYTGTDCETDINECVLNNQPCRNGAACLDMINNYSCNCSAGWTGQHCDSDIDDCSPNPCQNGAVCHNYQNYYNCTCTPGYAGKNCETNIDDCSPNPCQHESSCQDLVNGYNCNCSEGWMGKNCADVYDACSFAPCKNGATCSTTKPQREYSCACVLGYTGHDCETDIQDCRQDSCLHPFFCFDLVNNFTCACPTGYKGVNCSEEINECEPNPCQNGATCTDLIGNYTCQCRQTFVNLTKYGNGQKLEFLTGYTGRNCEIDIAECSLKPSICLNNGTCQGGVVGDYVCQCGPDEHGIYTAGKNCELRTSYCESSEIVKQDPPACKNGGTCISGDRTFSCLCAPGFTDTRCQTDIDECESSPCQYNGNCTDQVNGYTCDCIPGITGPNCETDINECESTPCQHGGQCQDRINGYDCNCTDTGFNGTECQFNIDDCAILLPCQNNASCTDLIKDYNCNCFTGYEGKDCEIDIDECVSNPCRYNGTCTQRSLQNLPDFSYFTAAGYDCSCIPGITGVNCETDIDECVNNTCQFGSTCVDQINGYTCACAPGYRGDRCESEIDECAENLPCRNGALCSDKIADYDCNCPEFFGGKQYGGKNCTVELTSCLNNECQNGATCKPYLINEVANTQGFTCACQNGFTGSLCQLSTTMSFNNDSYIKHTLSKLMNNTISFRFRTTLANGLLFAWDGNFVTSTLFCTVELYNGMVHVTYPSGEGNNAVTRQEHFPFLVNDANWHEVELVQSSMLSFELKSSKCTVDCKLAYSYTEGAPRNTTWFGKLTKEFKISKTISKSSLIGCMEDIKMNSLVLTRNVLNTPTTNSVNVEDGCPRIEQCFPNSCNNRGTCIDLWNQYKCVCVRPHHGNDCEKDFTPATFAEGDTTSWTSFDISGLKTALKTTVDISLFFRSRETDGLIMFLGDQGTTYITLELYQGYVLSRVVLCNNYRQAFFLNQTLFNNGEQHLARITIENSIFTLSVGAFSVSETMSGSCDLNADFLYFGGRIPDSFSSARRKRATEFTISVESISALSAVGKYKGTIQDIELNTQKLMFYSEPGIAGILANNVTSLKQGEVTDDICSSFPCENNGTCANVFFNDFNCTCPHGFIGKNCSELDFCKEQSCPAGADCHTLSDGFECISTATFSGGPVGPTVLSYTKHINSDQLVDEISLKFRTIVRNGHIMFIKNQNGRYIKIGLDGGNVVVISRLDSLSPQTITVDLFVSDNSWYTAALKQSDRDLTLTVTGSREVSKSILLSNNAISLQTLVNYGTSSPSIDLGVTSMFLPTAHHYYSGCLREVRIGRLLLPFYQQSAFKNFTTAQYFAVQYKSNLQEGCNGGTGCDYNQCQHGTSCLPDYYGYHCNCTGSGYQGDWCQINANNCEADKCNQGQCVDKVNDFYCKCPTGYSGTRCETASDACNPDPCQNNASCQSGNGGFTCTCPTTHIGQICDVLATSTCLQTPCKNAATCQHLANVTPSFSCSCPTGFNGDVCDIPIDYCKDFPCENGGNCSSISTDFQCSCPSGFSGKNCSVNNNDCVADVCQNGGSCIDMVNGYICNCTESWDGRRCENDVDECKRQPCERGTCQNTEGSYQCLCDNTGYHGQFCDQDVDECETTPCQNDGTCLNYDGGYNCTCSTGYKGVNCGTPDCNLVNCANGATCGINLNKWQCNCVKYYFGQLCELKGPCAYQPCNISNTQECIQENKVNGSYNCTCKSGWEGGHCDDDIDECKNPICQHQGTCDNTPGDYTCTCPPGYTDKNCSTDIDECATQPCQNNGVCTDQVNDFNCDCNNTGYTNKTCSDDEDECAQDEKCINKVKCENLPGDYTCSCIAGFIGKACDKKDPDKQKLSSNDDIMWYIIGPIFAVVLIAIVVVIIVFVMCARNKRATRGTYSPSRQEVTGSRVELGQVLKPPPEERLI